MTEKQKKTMYFYSDMERHAVKAFQEAYREAEREGSLSLLAVKQVGSFFSHSMKCVQILFVKNIV